MKIASRLLSSLLFGLAATASMQAMACYTVFDNANRVAYQGEQAPVDMSLPLHQALAGKYPAGSSMVFDGNTSCPSIITASRVAPVRGGTTLLTDQQTARAMNVPFTPMAGGLALVQPRESNMRPGLTVVPAETFAQARSSQAVAQAVAVRGSNGMITELRDAPPVVVSQLSTR